MKLIQTSLENDSSLEKVSALNAGDRGMSLSESIVSGLVGLADAVAILAVQVALYLFYVGWSPDNIQFYLTAVGVMTAVTISLFHQMGFYEFSTIVSWPTRMRHLLTALALVGLICVGVGFALKVTEEFSRVWFFGSLIGSAGLIVAERGFARLTIEKLATDGVFVRNIAIIGAGNQAEQLIARIQEQNAPWKHIVGVFDDRKTRIANRINNVPVLGSMSDLVQWVRQGHVHDVVITLPWSADERLVDIIRRLRPLPVHIHLGSDLIGYHFPRHRERYLGGVPVMHIAAAPLTGWSGLVKSIEDKIVATTVLMLFAPIMLLIAIAIRMESSGPVLFRQKRYGFNNRLIEVLKFRSMYHHMRDDDGVLSTSQQDARVTRVGAFLRRTSLDELPQLINVLRGEMSVVGPRPHAIMSKAGGRLFEEVVEEYAVRHKVKPGLTGWAQVNGWRGETLNEEDIKKRVELDLFYIENWTLWFDIRILLITAFIGWTGKRAY
jgi:Undecaprenyl-phosphate glucose phosphotransferase